MQKPQPTARQVATDIERLRVELDRVIGDEQPQVPEPRQRGRVLEDPIAENQAVDVPGDRRDAERFSPRRPIAHRDARATWVEPGERLAHPWRPEAKR
jgi:hypothetical protein